MNVSICIEDDRIVEVLDRIIEDTVISGLKWNGDLILSAALSIVSRVAVKNVITTLESLLGGVGRIKGPCVEETSHANQGCVSIDTSCILEAVDQRYLSLHI